MTRSKSRLFLTAVALAALTLSVVAQERDRAKIADKYKWNLADIYPTDAAWRAAKDKLAADLPQLRQYQGKLTSSAATLADALDKLNAFDKELSRLYVYASMLADQDTRDSGAPGHAAGDGAARVDIRPQTASFIEPEILKADKATIEQFMATEPRLKIYTFYLRDVIRRAAAHAQRRGGKDPRRRRRRWPARRRTSSTSCRTPIFRIRRSRSATAAR